MSLHLFEIEELAKTSQIGGGSQKFGHVSKRDSRTGANLSHLVALLLHLWSTLLLVEIGHKVGFQQDVIVAGTVKKNVQKMTVCAQHVKKSHTHTHTLKKE